MLQQSVVLVLASCAFPALGDILSLAEEWTVPDQGQRSCGFLKGSNCTWRGVNGTCALVHRCLSAEEYIKNRRDPPPICEFKGGDTVICCIDCELVDDARNIIIDNGYYYVLKKNGEKAHDNCLNYKHHLWYQDKLIGAFNKSWELNEIKNCQELVTTVWRLYPPAGGFDARPGYFPHMVLLGYGREWISAKWLCGGTLISAYFVLTAGHCISSPEHGPVTHIGVGMMSRSDPPGIWQRYRVKRRIKHTDYHPPSKYHDIALLETYTPILFNDISVKPACITKSDFIGVYCSATGWGALGHNMGLAETMQVVKLQEFSEEECMREYPPYRLLRNGYNHTTQMCYGRRDEVVDTCEGDSGGPLHDGEISYNVIGVTSFGRSCAISAGAGIYTRVSFYLPWIESIVWPDTE